MCVSVYFAVDDYFNNICVYTTGVFAGDQPVEYEYLYERYFIRGTYKFQTAIPGFQGGKRYF